MSTDHSIHECPDGKSPVRPSAFFALLGRTQLINRWSLMRNMWPENVQEHSFQTALIAQALVFVREVYFPENRPLLDPDRVLARALFHDVTEVITGDLPTPVKYHDESLRDAFRRLEDEAANRMLALLPADLRACYQPYVQGITDVEAAADFGDADAAEKERLREARLIEEETQRFIKLADKISALIKCRLETHQGNKEFEAAEGHTLDRIQAFNSPEAEFFIEMFLPDYLEPLDHYNV